MLSEDFFGLRHWLEDVYNTHSKIELSPVHSGYLINRLYEIEERIIALENAVVPENIRKPSIPERGNVVRIDLFKQRKGQS